MAATIYTADAVISLHGARDGSGDEPGARHVVWKLEAKMWRLRHHLHTAALEHISGALADRKESRLDTRLRCLDESSYCPVTLSCV